MFRSSSVILSLLVVLLIVGGPMLYRIEKYRTFRNFRIVEEGKVYRSGQMSPAGFERVCREYGIRTVIKLREASEKPADIAADEAEEAYCQSHGIVFHRVLPKSWEVEEGLLAVFGSSTATDPKLVPMWFNLRWFEQAMDDSLKTPQPVLIHCFAGIHRTGAMVAAYRMKYHGWTNVEAVAELRACGRSTSTYVGNLIPYLTDKFRLIDAVGEPAVRR